MAGVRSTLGHDSGRDIELFRDHDRRDLDGKLITSGHPSMSRCLAGCDMVEVPKNKTSGVFGNCALDPNMVAWQLALVEVNQNLDTRKRQAPRRV
jgi:hypothetical protein